MWMVNIFRENKTSNWVGVWLKIYSPRMVKLFRSNVRMQMGQILALRIRSEESELLFVRE